MTISSQFKYCDNRNCYFFPRIIYRDLLFNLHSTWTRLLSSNPSPYFIFTLSRVCLKTLDKRKFSSIIVEDSTIDCGPDTFQLKSAFSTKLWSSVRTEIVAENVPSLLNSKGRGWWWEDDSFPWMTSDSQFPTFNFGWLDQFFNFELCSGGY